jgi:hypothetical protein
MSISLRLFLFAPDGLKRISHRLMSGLTDGRDALPQYAGKKLKLAQVVVHLADGRPSEIARIYGTYLHLDHAGKADEAFAKASYEASDMVDALGRFESHKAAKVVSLAPKLQQRRYQGEHCWEPSKQDIEMISQMLFGTGGKRPGARGR